MRINEKKSLARFYNAFLWIYANTLKKIAAEKQPRSSNLEYARKSKALQINRPFFLLFRPLHHPQTNFLLRSKNLRAIDITSFWPEKDRLQIEKKSAAHETRKKRQFKGEPKVGHAAEKGMTRGENPKRICSIVVMMNLQRSTFFPLGPLAAICPYYLVALSIGLSTIKSQPHTWKPIFSFTASGVYQYTHR